MMSSPKPGQDVQVWYAGYRRPPRWQRVRAMNLSHSIIAIEAEWRRRLCDRAPLHGQAGRVVVVSRGPGPKNHGVVVGGRFHVVPAGQLNPARDDRDDRQLALPLADGAEGGVGVWLSVNVLWYLQTLTDRRRQRHGSRAFRDTEAHPALDR